MIQFFKTKRVKVVLNFTGIVKIKRSKKGHAF